VPNPPKSGHTLSIKTIVAGPLETNTYLISSGGQGLVIDPGYGAAELVRARAESNECEIVAIVSTHGHWDHVADDAQLIRDTGAPLYVHEYDAEMVRSPSTSLSLPFTLEPANPTKLLRDGDVVNLDDWGFKVIHTPGHTPGSVCLLFESEGIVVTGDTLFQGTYGRFDFPGGDEEALYDSLRILGELDGEYSVYPGHGPTTTIGAENGWISRL
jgi:glyoxylase-like metal-dependent hydrolase (beta-lactamase superfamily II)